MLQSTLLSFCEDSMSSFDQAILALEQGEEVSTQPTPNTDEHWQKFATLVEKSEDEKYTLSQKSPSKLSFWNKTLIWGGAVATLVIFGGITMMITGGAPIPWFLTAYTIFIASGLVLTSPLITRHEKPATTLRHRIYEVLGYHNMNPDAERAKVYQQLIAIYNRQTNNDYYWNEIISCHKKYVMEMANKDKEFVEIVIEDGDNNNQSVLITPSHVPDQAPKPCLKFNV